MIKIITYLILITFLALLVISIIYLSKRFAWWFGIESATPLIIVFSAITLFFLAGGMPLTDYMHL